MAGAGLSAFTYRCLIYIREIATFTLRTFMNISAYERLLSIQRLLMLIPSVVFVCKERSMPLATGDNINRSNLKAVVSFR